jgi:uncharacterized protein YraI
METQTILAGRRVGRRLLLVAVPALALAYAASTTGALAQTESFPTGATVRVANTDGQNLNLRAGPSVQQSIVARLPAGETLTVTGASRTAEGMRWLPVRTAAAQTGWVASDYVILQSAPPTPTRTPTPQPTPTSSVVPSAGASSSEGSEAKGQPVEVEAKLKFPELDGRQQEITVWVTRDGVPIQGATVTLETDDGDDDEKFRELDPTNEEGRTRRSFDVRDEKGTVELRVEAVAPDGGEGRTIVSYFRR